MKKKHVSAQTPAIAWLLQRDIPFKTHVYKYKNHGGAGHAAAALGLDLHYIAKTLVMENELGQPLIVLMHGSHEVSLKQLARQTGHRSITPCTPRDAQRHSGYLVGGTSPFATRKPMPVWAQDSLLALPEIHINGGQRGLLLTISSAVLTDELHAQPVQAALTVD